MEQLNLVDGFIEALREKRPFSVLPEASQPLALDLRRNVELGQKDLALTQLDRLAVSLGTTIDIVNREATTNRNWTVLSALLGGVGVISTIVISIILGQRNTGKMIRSITELIRAEDQSAHGKKEQGSKNVQNTEKNVFERTKPF